MLRIVRAAAIASALSMTFAVSPGRVHAQQARTLRPMRDVMSGASLRTMESLRGNCPAFIVQQPESPDGGLTAPLKSRTCTNVSIEPLGSADGHRWIVAKYLQREAGASPADTFELMHVVLLSSRPDGNQWRPEWYTWIEPHMIRSLTPTIGVLPDGSGLLALLYCWNGTGGCWQAFLHRSGGRWHAVETPYAESLAGAAKRYRLLKSSNVDVRTLQGVAGAYLDADGNCCPGHEIHFNVVFRGDSLKLGRYRLTAVKEPR